MKTQSRKMCIVAIILLVIFCALGFAGCIYESGSYLVKGAKTTARKGNVSAEYFYFNGTRKYACKFGGGEQISVVFTTDDGNLSYKITDGKGNVVKDGTANNDSFVITVEEAGLYTFEFAASAHKGSYKLTW